MEHHANIVPWQQLAKRKHASLKFIPMTDDGELTIENIKQQLMIIQNCRYYTRFKCIRYN